MLCCKQGRLDHMEGVNTMERLYETTFVLKPDLEEEVRDSLLDRIRNIILDNNGELVDVDIWGKRKLAYEINDYRTGFYTIIVFKGDTETINELERNYKIIDDVLRSLIIRKDN